MADIRCPMCGKLNDAELEVCQFCQARLKPVWAVHSPEERSPEGKAPEKGSPPQKKDADLPDWLRALRPDSEEDQPAGGEDDPLPDWLSSLHQDTPESPEEPPTDAEETPAEPADETPDWLRGLREDSRRDAPPASGFDTGARGAQNFYDDPAGEDDLPSWLVHSSSDSEPPSGPVSSGSPASEDDFDFDDRDDSETGTGAEPAGEIPSWLNQGWGSEPGEPSEEDQPAGAAAETPDWLQSDWGSEPGDHVEKSSPSEPASEVPDWLSSNWESEPDEPDVSAEPASSSPEWLNSDWQAETSGEGDVSSPADLAQEEEKAAGWLNDSLAEVPEVQALSPMEEGGEPAGEPAEPPGEQPAAGPDAEPETAGLLTPEETGQDWLLEPIDQDLGWLDELAQETDGAASETPAELPAGGSMIFDDDDTEDLRPLEQGLVPDWLRGMRSDAGGLTDSSAGNEPIEESVEFAESEAAPSSEAVTPPPSGEEGLEHAELPTWLQAMRPVDTSMAASLSRPEKEVEGAGPLAGIHGVLPAEPDVSHVGKPAAPSYKLQVPEAQQAQADLFRELIAEEGRVAPLQKRREISSQHLLRILIALLLALAALAPLFSPGLESPLPVAPAGVQAAHQIVSGLPNGSPVLVSIDYEPGWSSELDPAASSLIRDLLARGALLSLVSTAPTGPLQAERVMATVNAANLQTGQPAGEYLNLGFIPGGAAGLSSLAQLPQFAVSGTLNGQDPWSQPQLQTVRSLSDFALVLVVTESPDDARAWIEQVQPVMADTPLVMVVSAQAQPLVEPYFRATPNQVQGLVTGLLGSKQYEQLAGAPAAAQVSWTSYSLVLWTAVLLLFLGALVNAASAWLSARKRSDGGEG